MKHYLLLFILLPIIGFSQDINFCNDYKKVFSKYNELAYKPLNADSLNGQAISRSFIKQLDPSSLHFKYKDIEEFNSLSQALTNNYMEAYCIEKEKLNNIFKVSLENSRQILQELKEETLNFQENDSIFRPSEFSEDYYILNKKERWKNHIKHRILRSVIESTNKYDSLSSKPEMLERYIKSSKQKVLDQELKRISSLTSSEKKIEEFVYYSLVNSILTKNDPHSYYFSRESFTRFKDQVSDFSSSYGITFSYNSQNKYVISSIIPGSFAWRIGQINIGDVIISFSFEGQPKLELEFTEPDDLIEYLSFNKSDKLTMEILDKQNNKIETQLVKEELKNTEHSVQAFVLNGKRKVGYILLPAFYTVWESDKSFGCAQDVAWAIYALNNEKIESLILDLRNNGGGSMTEAIELAGIFIDYGNVSVEQNRNKEVTSLKDYIRGTMYSGPLAIMTNQSSASASELVSAVLQDYNRAIIVGANTFGKATVQSIVPVGIKEGNIKPEDYQENDILKVTTSKFYRVTGSSHQKTGVHPDIILPNPSGLHITESDFEEAFDNDSVLKKIYFKELNKLPIDDLQKKSRKRVDSSRKFQMIEKLDEDLISQMERKIYTPLSIKSYYNYMKDYEAIIDVFDSIRAYSTDEFTIKNLEADKERISLYEHYKLLDERNKELILTDPYIEETYNVLIDYTNLSK